MTVEWSRYLLLKLNTPEKRNRPKSKTITNPFPSLLGSRHTGGFFLAFYLLLKIVQKSHFLTSRATVPLMYEPGAVVDAYLTANEVALFVKLSLQTIRRYTMNKEIPFHKIGRSVRYKKSEIELWVEKRETETTQSDLFSETVTGSEET